MIELIAFHFEPYIAPLLIIAMTLTIAAILVLALKPESLQVTCNDPSDTTSTLIYSRFIEIRRYQDCLYYLEEKSGYWLKETALTPAEKQLVSHLPVNKVSKKPI